MTDTQPVSHDHDDDRAVALEFLRTHHILTLAVADRDGPWAAALFYVSHDFRCYFLSDPNSRHARAITADSRVAATVQDQPEDWTAIQGIQIEGHARRLSGRPRTAAITRYLTRFPGASADPQLVAPIRHAATYELVPSRVVFIDNRRFGQRVDVPIDDRV